MDAYNDPSVREVVVMSSAQVGKTELINNMIGYIIDQNPGPILVLNPTLEMSKTWSKDRFSPMLRDSPCLKGKVKSVKSKDTSNTILHKVFPGGHITMAGANSPASLASRPIRDFFADEVDRYPVSAGAEGDPINLGKKRATTFWNRKHVFTSTPTVKGASRIELAYDSSDKRKYYVPCPHCGKKQVLKWSQVKWDKNENLKKLLASVRYECEFCKREINDSHKQAMLLSGEWIAENEFHKTAGFHLNELYSPWVKFSEVVETFLESKDNPELLKTWVNTSLGETWEESGEEIDGSTLIGRREEYTKVPNEVLVIVAGVDVQDDRLEIGVDGFGAGYECWGIDYRILWGDPKQPEVWENLDDVLSKIYESESGSKLAITCTCVDSGGHHTQIVYDFCKQRKSKRVFATKGVSGSGRPIVSAPSFKKSGREKRKVDLYTIGVDSAKASLYSSLQVTTPGSNYHHFNYTFDEEYFSQLTAEKLVTRFRKGFPVKEWVKTRPRNEALDIKVLCKAAVVILNPVFEVIKKKKEASTVVENVENQETPAKQILNDRRNRNPSRRRSSYMNRWRNQ